MLLKILAAAVLLYGLVVLLIVALQDRLLFPTYAVPAGASVPPGWQRLAVATPDGITLEGVHVPPVRSSDERLLVLVFPGNGWNALDAAALLHRTFPASHTVAFHYRGYAPSSGRASSAALLRDAPLVLQAARKQVAPTRTVVVGFSIGSGVAADAARQQGVGGAILVTPFDSLAAVARSHYPWLPVRAMFRHKMDAAVALRGSYAPVAIIAAEQDSIIPASSTQRLREAAPRRVFDRTIAGAGHNDLYARPEFVAAIREAMVAVLTASDDGADRP